MMILGLFASAAALSQTVLPPEAARTVDQAMNGGMTAYGKLNCHTQNYRPFLDFALRFEAGFVTTCDLAQFEGRPTALAVYIRLIPENGSKTILGLRLNLPKISEERKAQMNWKRFHQQIEFSGPVALGEGKYRAELLLVDDRNRIHRKDWNLKVSARGKEKSIDPSIGPGKVSALTMLPRKQKDRPVVAGRRITVLLDAAPVVPWSLKLRAWDRAFLLGSLSSLVRQSGASQVRVVAFNLDQQREIFRDESFNDASYGKLGAALQSMELGAISYRTLQRAAGWADLLVGLINSEIAHEEPADAVVFLGPNCRIREKVDPDGIRARADIGPRLFYFEYFFRVGSDFPDAIHQLASACRGTIYKLHSPADFAGSIAKLQRRLDPDTAAP